MHADLPDVLARMLPQRPAEITPGAAPESPAAMRGWGPAISLRRRRRRLAKSLGGHGLRSFENRKSEKLQRYRGLVPYSLRRVYTSVSQNS